MTTTPATELSGANACSDAITFANQYSNMADAWNNCTKIEWMTWLLFRQTTTMAERQRITTGLLGMLSTFVDSEHLPVHLSQVTSAVTQLSTLPDQTSATTLSLPLQAAAAKLSDIKSGSTTQLEIDICSCFAKLLIIGALPLSRTTSAADFSADLGRFMRKVWVGSGTITNNSAGDVALATQLRSAISFTNLLA